MLGRRFVSELAHSEPLISAVRPYLPGPPRPVRAIYFNKSSETHQADVPGFGPWSTKDGVVHVQPPVELLQDMITLRLHLDDTDESNGALKVLQGSHVYGRLAAADIERLRGSIPEEICRAQRGDALLMRPLLLHASGRSTSDRHRRILHIEYAGNDLPDGLHWHHDA